MWPFYDSPRNVGPAALPTRRLTRGLRMKLTDKCRGRASRTGYGTLTGDSRSVVVPSPIWPLPLLPQQYRDLAVVMAQLWTPPAWAPAQTPLVPIFLGD